MIKLNNKLLEMLKTMHEKLLSKVLEYLSDNNNKKITEAFTIHEINLLNLINSLLVTYLL